MKTRIGFVSNSSSSNFVVIGKPGAGYEYPPIEDKHFTLEGAFEFGWEHTIYKSLKDRIAWAYLQTHRGSLDNEANDIYLKMLNEVLRDIGAQQIKWKLDSYSYIDHQSINDEIFSSKEVLKEFLFNKGSYIQGGNDNG